MEEVLFEVGDEVIITKSEYNWHPNMDIFDKKVVIIKRVFSNNYIEFENDEDWTWKYDHGHFKLHKKANSIINEDISYLTLILKKLNIK